MTRAAFVSVVGGVLWLGLAAPVAAQPDSGTIFIGAGVVASVERSARSSSFGFEVPDRDGTVPGGVLTLGVHLTPKVSARVEWAMTDWLEYDSSYGVLPLFTRPGIANMFSDVSIFPPQRFDGRQRAKTAFALLGYHLGSRRASVEVLGGLGVLAETTRTSYDVRIATAVEEGRQVVLLPRGESTYSEYRAVGVTGVDVAVGLTDHAAVVPQLRMYVSGGGLTLRPGLGVRWTF